MIFYFPNKKDLDVFTKTYLKFQEFSVDNEWNIEVIEN